MEPEAAFAHAALPLPVTVLGQTLEPYSIGHELLLTRHESFFVFMDKKDIDPEQELFLAVWICAHTYEDAAREMASQELPKTISNWKRKVKGGFLGFCQNEVNLLGKIHLLAKHRRDALDAPKYTVIKDKNIKPLRQGAPEYAVILNTLMANLHLSFSEAINMPLGLAFWQFLTYWESQGRVTIGGSTSSKTMEAMSEYAARNGMVPMSRADFN